MTANSAQSETPTEVLLREWARQERIKDGGNPYCAELMEQAAAELSAAQEKLAACGERYGKDVASMARERNEALEKLAQLRSELPFNAELTVATRVIKSQAEQIARVERERDELLIQPVPRSVVITALQAKLRECERDTQRLNWYEAQHTIHYALEVLYGIDSYLLSRCRDGNFPEWTVHGDTLRAAIDAAIEKEVKKGETNG